MTANQLLFGSLFVATVALFALQFSRRAVTTHRQWLASTFAFGSVLRFIYCCLTPYQVRAWDWSGHIEYIDYVMQHWRIPPAQGGWQFYQPPLYYFGAAVWAKLNVVLGRSEGSMLLDFRLAACLMSIATLAVGIWIGEMLFAREGQKQFSIWLAALLAVFPGFVHFASRISNDVPLMLFSFLLLAFVIRWWQGTRERDVYLACGFLCLGLLTKLNMLPLVPLLPICLAFKRSVSWPVKARIATVCLAMIVLSTGWLFYQRYVVERERGVVGNRLHERLAVENAPAHLLVFNPVAVLRHPYNNCLRDQQRRDYFWEFAYRSTHFGEFHHGENRRPLAQALLLLGYVGLPLMIAGIVITLRHELYDRLPLLLVFALLVAALFCYRLTTPFACNQDYRFIPLVIVPAVYFVLRAIAGLSARWQTVALAGVAIYSGGCALFTLWLVI